MKKLFLFIGLISNVAYSQVINKPQHDPPVVVNVYTEVIAYDICTNQFTVANDSAFNVGDTVLLIQMKGAVIDTGNTAAFGTVLDYKNAGNYEFNYISQKTGNVFTFKNKLTKNYDIPTGVVQLVRVPSYKVVNFFGGLTCDPWNGSKGGILAVIGTLSLYSSFAIDVSNKGFKGGEGYNAVYSASTCNQNQYRYSETSQFAGNKGESITTTLPLYSKGKGSLAGGGGGGNSHNAGGGGGSNAGSGGFGGYQTDSCGSAAFDNRGIGGKTIPYTSVADKIFLGSGGGAGHMDNSNMATDGGAGGGIVIIITPELIMDEEGILALGGNGAYCFSADCNDGMGGGGGGGTVLLSINQLTSPDGITVTTQGGDGGNIISSIAGRGRPGPGGGGGGGAFYYKGSSLPASINYIANGGAHGIIVTDGNNAHGSTDGNPGLNFFNLILPVDTVTFKPNIDSVKIKDTVNYCNNIQFTGLGFTNTYPVAASGWQWFFGDGGSSTLQNPIHNYNAVGNYNVKLIVTDINGCKDSISKIINTAGTMLAEAGRDTAFCVSGLKTFTLNGSGTGSFSWSPAAVLNNSTLQNPTATINATTKFYLTVSNGTGCSAIDSVTVTINQNPVVKTLKDTTICKNGLLILTTNGAVNYNWSPGIYVSDSTIANPAYTDTNPRTLIVTGTDVNGCKAKDTIDVDVKNRTTFISPQSKTICRGTSVQLDGNNGSAFQYVWSPVSYLSNPAIEKPIANPPFTQAYNLKVSDNICKNDSSFTINITVIAAPTVKATKSNDLNCNKPFTQLNATGAATYTWVPAYALTNDSIANPIANPATTTTYYVYGKDSTICAGTDSIKVVADFKNHGIILPNSFTPNNDGLNDCFGIKYYRDITNLEFIIFNRYGGIVFKTTNANDCWDGNYKGKPASPGSYVYYIKAKTLCGNVEIKDNVLLLR